MLLKKLRVKAERPLVIVNLPDSCASLFAGLDFQTKRPKTGSIEQLIFFAKDAASIATGFVPLVSHLSPDPLVWVMYPKKSGSIKSDLSMHNGWQPAFNTGLLGVASAAVDDDWSGFRMRPAALVKSVRAPAAERSSAHIDYVSRTVVLPPDAEAVIRKHRGMFDYFHALAFTHRKEHVDAIVSAKRPETRERRIEKMVEVLSNGMQAKRK